MGNAAIASAQNAHHQSTKARKTESGFGLDKLNAQMKARKSKMSINPPHKIQEMEAKIKFLTCNMTYDSIKRGSKLNDLIQRSYYSDHIEIMETLKALSEIIKTLSEKMTLSGGLSMEMAECCSNVMKQIETTFIQRINTIDFQNERISLRLFAILKDLVFFYHLIKYLKEEGVFSEGKWWKPKTDIVYAEKLQESITDKCIAILENYDQSSEEEEEEAEQLPLLLERKKPSEKTIIRNLKQHVIDETESLRMMSSEDNQYLEKLDQIEEMPFNLETSVVHDSNMMYNSNMMHNSIKLETYVEKIQIKTEKKMKECTHEVKNLKSNLEDIFKKAEGSKAKKMAQEYLKSNYLNSVKSAKTEAQENEELMRLTKNYLNAKYENALEDIEIEY